MKNKVKIEGLQVVVETPKGSTEKYAYDANSGFFRLTKVLPAGMVFPFDFGFISGTKGDDGDPLDIIVISEFHSYPGCMIDCRLLGAIKAEQGKNKNKLIRNDRFVAIPLVSKAYNDIANLTHVPKEMIESLESFFINYNKEEKKIFKCLGYIRPSKALQQIKSQFQ